MKKIVLLCGLALAIFASSAVSQTVYFGKNKVRYKDFDWNYIQTPHFDLYFYEDAYDVSKFAAAVMESAYVEIVEELDYRLQEVDDRVPVFIYNSHNDFQQTNITPGLLPEGVGGFTEAFKNRVVIPFDGSYEDFRHVLHHELTHAMVFDLLYGGNIGSLITRQRLFNVPLWFAEGYAEYSSRHGWDYQADMFVRDATINGYLAPPGYIRGFLAYKQGQAMVKYIADNYGEKEVGEILRKGKVHLSMDRAMKSATGIELEKFWEEFSKEMKRRYWPEIAKRQEAKEFSKQLTKARQDGSYFNDKPAFSPEGDKIAIFTDKNDYTEIMLISAADGKEIKTLVKSATSSGLESLHWYVSGISFSPDGRDIVFVAKSDGQESLVFLNVDDANIYKKIKTNFHGIVSPTWSPDGEKVAFSALTVSQRDIYVYDIKSGQTTRVTNDRFDDVSPSWLPDSDGLVFSSDRPHPRNPVLDHLGHPYVDEGAYRPGTGFDYGTYNIFRIDLNHGGIEPVDVGPGQNTFPSVAPDGKKIAFISNRNGIDNIYIGYLDTVKFYAVTDILTGVRSFDWSPDGTQLTFSAFQRGSFDVFLMKDIIPAGENGVLEPTAYVLGEYDLIDPGQKGRIAQQKQKSNGEPDEPPIAGLGGDEDPEFAVSDSLSLDDDTATEAEDTSTVASAPEGSDEESEAEADTTSSVASSGVYGDEYVHVSDKTEKSATDSLFTDVANEDSIFFAQTLAEPDVFDSVSSKTPDGEYEIKDYKPKLTLDLVQGGGGYDTFFGFRGSAFFLFSDYLGNHQILVYTDLVNSFDQSFIQAFYINNKNRTNFGVGVMHTKNFYLQDNPTPIDQGRDIWFSDRVYGAQLFARRPFSTFSRVELNGSQWFINRNYLTPEREEDLEALGLEDRDSRATTVELSYVYDNVLWGYTGPVNGRRWKFSLETAVNLFNTDDIEYYAAELDYRKYWHFTELFSMAFRVSGGYSEGNTPKRYFLGGTSNWIGNRTFDAEVFDVENLYFSDVVTPLRGEDYYDLSGSRYGLVNWEFRFPLVQYFAMRFPLPIVFSNVQGALFTDVGAAWDGDNFKGGTSEGGRNRLQDIKTGFGLGIRLNLFGFALLRYDVAWSTDWYEISDKPKHYFSFGADF